MSQNQKLGAAAAALVALGALIAYWSGVAELAPVPVLTGAVVWLGVSAYVDAVGAEKTRADEVLLGLLDRLALLGALADNDVDIDEEDDEDLDDEDA